MAMDIKNLMESMTEKVNNDKDIKEKFEKDPVKAIEGLVGMKLPDEISADVINNIKSSVESEGLAGTLGNLSSLLGKK